MINSILINLILFPYYWLRKGLVAGKELVLVVGMHRSGSSAFMGVLRILGLQIGDHLIPPMPENPKGFFEDTRFVKLNNEILRRNYTAWYFTEDIMKRHHVPIFLKIRLFNLIVKNLCLKDHFGLKDPRLSILAPVYIDVCNRLKIKLKVLVINREKKSVVSSLLKRNHPPGITQRDYEELYDYYSSSIQMNYKKHIIEEIEFTDLIKDTGGTLQKVVSHFSYLQIMPDKMLEINDFLEIDLVHNK